MKKKLIGLLVFLIAMVGDMYFMGVFDKGKADDASIQKGNEISNDKGMNDALDNAEMPKVEVDSVANEMEVGEYDPADML